MAVVRRFALALLVGLFWSMRLGAQAPTGTITGRVVDATSQQGVADVSVVVDGTRRGAVTAADGSFTIGGVPAGAQTVRARRIGFTGPAQTVNVPTNGSVSIVLSVERQAVSLEEVVTTGYGTQRRVAITGSVATVDADKANVGVTANVNQMIQGRATGVQITQNSGEPGAGAQITIRGGSSISASNEPLYVIDGVPVNNTGTENPGSERLSGRSATDPAGSGPPLSRSPLDLINPADIASISILKDAAAAIYGTRAANGVILIETKKGQGGGPSIQYDFYAGTSWAPKLLDLVTGDQYRAFVADQVAAKVPGFSQTQIDLLGTANTDWQKELFHHGTTFNHDISFAGGSPTTQYRASLNYMNQEGIVISSGFKRLQGRINGTHQAMNGRLRLGTNLTASNINNDYIPYENAGGFEGGVFVNMVQFNPTHPVTVTDPNTGITTYYELGTGAQSDRNPVGLANQIQNVGKTTRVLGNGTVDFDIFNALTARVLAGVDRSDGNRSDYFPRSSPAGAGVSGDARQAERTLLSKTIQTVLTFHPEFAGDNAFDLLGGYEYNDYSMSEFIAEAQGFLTDALGYNGLSTGSTLITPSSYAELRRLVGFFTKANYSFRDTYFLTGSLRRDGASQFGAGNKWAVFPAISGSWRLSQSGFVPKGPFSELRLRAGWGRLGNPGVPAYASLIRLSADEGSRYVFGETPVVGFVPVNNANPDLKWETTDQTNVALDYGLMDNRISGSLEYYVKNTHDLLLSVPVPQPAVVSNRLQNIGKMSNKGVEFSLDGQVLNRATSNWSVGLVYSADRNKVIDLGTTPFYISGIMSGQGQSGQSSQRILPGQPLGTFYGPHFVGVCAAAGCSAGPDGVPGNADDPKPGQQLFTHYVVDANGKLTASGTTASPGGNDLIVLGDANPKWTLGLRTSGNWNRFDFSALINSQHGQKVLNETALVYETKSNAKNSKNFLAAALNDGVGPLEASKFSDRFIEDGSFWRLQNVTVGYTFDLPRFTGTARNTRVYLSGDNLILSTKYTGFDPEVYSEAGLAARGIDYLHYPRARTITGGIRVGF